MYHTMCNGTLVSCTAYLELHMQALAEQQMQLETSMSHYPLEVQQASLTVLTWQAHMAALYASPRYPPFAPASQTTGSVNSCQYWN